MPLKNKTKQLWEILFYQHNEERCDAEEYLEEIPIEDYQGFVAKIDLLASKGKDCLAKNIFHEAGEDYILYKGQTNETRCKMYGLRHGRHRLYAILIEKQKLIIFTHGTLKKTQKTDKKDKERFKSIVKRLKDEGEL